MVAGPPKIRHGKRLSLLLLALPLLGVGGLAEQGVNISVPQSLFLTCSTSLTTGLTQSITEAAQPFKVGSWNCNVDALTRYHLNSIIINADPADFATNCLSATGGGSPRCTARTALSGSDPDTRRGTGGNTAGTTGADFFGEIVVNVTDLNAATLPGSDIGTIVYSVTDATP